MAMGSATTSIPELAGIDEYVHATMESWRVPGVAIAVVKDGAVILAQGYGLRDVANNLPVTPDTLFAIGSCTKAFTTMAMGMLVDDGTLDWDTPVREYLPSFALQDPVASQLMTPRDLVTHRSGLPRHDLMWHQAAFTRQELLARLRHLTPNKTFRQGFQYQNLMYMTAGQLSGQVAGMEWEDLIRERILAPLGMRRSNISVQPSQADDDHARPYDDDQEAIKQVQFADISAIGPAGSINSSVSELCAWLLLHLNKGLHGQTRLISEAQLSQMHTPQVIVPDAGKHEEMPYAAYGLGWVVQPYRGQPMLWHTGGIDGFLSQVALLPRQNAGIVVLTNLGAGSLCGVLTYHLCDRLLGLDHLPWDARLKKQYDEARAAVEAGKSQAAGDRVPDTTPSHRLEEYTGEFAHTGYGAITISLEGEALIACFNQKMFPLRHFHYDTFETQLPFDRQRLTASFGANTAGDVDSLAIPFEPSVPPIIFQRLPDKRPRERAYLEPFTGDYEVMDRIMAVRLKGDDALSLAIPDQPVYELEPTRDARFQVKGLPGAGIAFIRAADGMVIEAVLTQPGGTVIARRL